MNDTLFLSDNINFNSQSKYEKEQTFISDKIDKIKREQFLEIKKNEKGNELNYKINSATTRKWSIKFK